MQLGAIMKEARERAGLSQYDLAWLAKVSRPQVIGIEKGTVFPRFDTLQKLCAALQLEIIIRDKEALPAAGRSHLRNPRGLRKKEGRRVDSLGVRPVQ